MKGYHAKTQHNIPSQREKKSSDNRSMSPSPQGSPLSIPNTSKRITPVFPRGTLPPNAALYPTAIAQDSSPCTAPVSTSCAASFSGKKNLNITGRLAVRLGRLHVIADALGVVGRADQNLTSCLKSSLITEGKNNSTQECIRIKPRGSHSIFLARLDTHLLEVSQKPTPKRGTTRLKARQDFRNNDHFKTLEIHYTLDKRQTICAHRPLTFPGTPFL